MKGHGCVLKCAAAFVCVVYAEGATNNVAAQCDIIIRRDDENDDNSSRT